MRILASFDSGALPPYEFTEKGIRFDLRPGQVILNVLVQDAPQSVKVDLLVDEQGERFIRRQGLLVSNNGKAFRPVPLNKRADGVLHATIHADRGEVRLASRYPYGRDNLERLICETAAKGGIAWRFLQGEHRGIPMAELGRDDGQRPVHYFIAGEDAWETAGSWAADEMVREFRRNGKLAQSLSKQCLIRIVPLASPYSATTTRPSYCTVSGDGIYGAATWGDPTPPSEFAVLRELVEGTIRESRLGYMMTLHSWQGAQDYSGLETIKSAGTNVLSEARQAWAVGVMEQMIDGIPKGRTNLSEKIWHPGLARDFLLARHNVITFRIEITTAGFDLDGFRATGRRLLLNLASITDWAPVKAFSHKQG